MKKNEYSNYSNESQAMIDLIFGDCDEEEIQETIGDIISAD